MIVKFEKQINKIMKNEKLFNETVDILVKAYQNDTLVYTSCARCAVGNIVSARNPGISYFDNLKWANAIHVGTGKIYSHIQEDALRQIETTGYTVQDVADIEKAFYFGSYGLTEDNWNEQTENSFDGLMAVVDALMLIHEANEVQVKEAKSLFVKA